MAFASKFNMLKNELKSIQVLRALAVILVVMFHFRFDADAIITNSQVVFANGSIGVDLFFVISGFIIYYVTDNNKHGVHESIVFIIKRISRVAPPYYIISVLFAYFYTGDYSDLFNSFLFLPKTIYEAPFFGYPSLVVGWSLNYEMYFYIATAVGISILSKIRWPIILSLMMAPIICMALYYGNISLSSAFIYTTKYPYLSMISNPIIIDFALGVFCGWMTKKDYCLSDKFVVTMSILIFMIVYIGISRSEHGPIVWGAASLLITFSFVELEKRKLIYLPKTMIYIGNISFSIYLIHIPALKIILYIFNTYTPTFNMTLRPECLFLSALLLTAIMSLGYHYIVEKTLCDTLRKIMLFIIYKTKRESIP
ncbi:exopolysaccharide production protein [Buttiauxella gaviniae ATCC 51604]|uniref:Exopolysaccharide production protein n=1 Tax=Buttiauxella gaviniae ATCC 51604 TaxID=1354253 RepID=A0A1B7I685_9ENTR|nr:acyltransferase [Buttiauxella gaviniae]OAT23965.1 exopolysaccharide production protein [Buttiauxella gaviniae ATCC 51604]